MSSFLEKDPAVGLLCAVQALARKKKQQVYLVGGAVRDALAGRRKDDPDMDFCLASGGIEFARRLAASLKAGFVALDEEHGTGRVVKKLEGGRIFTLDFSDFKGKTIEEDLRNRDFAVNAMAVPVAGLVAGGSLRKSLLDPCGGKRDLSLRLVRMVDPRVFDDDPLRVLRGFSTAAIIKGQLEPRTLRMIRGKKDLLGRVSSERVRDEFFKIFSAGDSSRTVALLDAQGVLEVVVPEISAMKRMRQGPYHHLDVWGHTLETLRRLEQAGPHWMRPEQVREYLGEQVSPGRSRWQLLKLAAILHDIGKPAAFRASGKKVTFYGHDREGSRTAAAIARRLRLSNEEERFLRRVVAMHLRPGFLASLQKVTAKALFRFFRDAGREAGSILVLSQADLRATRGYLLVEETRGHHERLIKRLLRDFFQRQECPPPARMINGDDLIGIGLEPSPLFGKILRQLEELQAEGKITTKAQGLERARALARVAGGRRGA